MAELESDKPKAWVSSGKITYWLIRRIKKASRTEQRVGSKLLEVIDLETC